MRVAYAGYDFFSPCLRLLVDRLDTEVVLVFTGERCENVGMIEALADEAGAFVFHGKPTDVAWSLLNAAKVDLLITAAYSFRVPVSSLDLPAAVNVHPSLLPMGRGPNPLPYLVDDHPEAAGVTLHLMEDSFDTGPVIIQQAVEMRAGWKLADISLAIIGTAPILLGRFLNNAEELIRSAIPQGPGSYWPSHGADNFTIDLARSSIQAISLTIHHFGGLPIMFMLADGSSLSATQAQCVPLDHCFEPGRIVGGVGTDFIATALDGLVRIMNPSTKSAQ